MLPRAARLRRSSDFRCVVRTGRRAGGRVLVLHAVARGASQAPSAPRVGFVVGRPVGGAVLRNQVRRRLRAVLTDRLGRLEGNDVVVRALPPSGVASSEALAIEVDRLLPRVLAVRLPRAGTS